MICSIGFMMFMLAGCAAEHPSYDTKEDAATQCQYDWCYDEWVCK